MSIKLESEEIFFNYKKDFTKLLTDTVGKLQIKKVEKESKKTSFELL